MHTNSARAMVEMAVKRGIREIESGNCRRAVRSLVEDGRHFIRKGYPTQLLASLLDMFRVEAHPYFELLAYGVRTVSPRYIMGFIINLCYESWFHSAKTLRAQQKQSGITLSWYQALDMDTVPLGQITARIDQATARGVNTFVLHSRALPFDTLQALCAVYPHCAFAFFAPDEAFTDAALDGLTGTDNLLLVPIRREGDFQSPLALKAHRRLYGLARLLDEPSLRRLMAGGDLSCPGDDKCILPIFLPDATVPDSLRSQFNQWIESLRGKPAQPVFPVDLPSDFNHVQSRLIK